LLRHHLANLVGASALLGNHLANLVAASLGPLLRHHLANLVGASTLLGNHLADLVAASLGAGFAHVLGAADLFLMALRNPNLLAAGAVRTLAANLVAAARDVAAAAAAGIIHALARRADRLRVRLTRNRVLLGFPVTGLNIDRLRVLHRHANVIGDLASAIFPNGLADRVAAGPLFVARLADRVAKL
jgi:hypothetical protein